MRKALFSVSLLLSSLSVFAQDSNLNAHQEMIQYPAPVDSATGKVSYHEVVQVDSIPANQLYIRARQWYVSTFKNAKEVLQMDDKEAGILAGKAFQDIYIKTGILPVKTQMWYTVSIKVKDGRYKYEITDIFFKSYPDKYNSYTSSTSFAEAIITDEYVMKKNGKKPNLVKMSYRENAASGAQSLIASLKKSMQSSALVKSGKEDW